MLSAIPVAIKKQKFNSHAIRLIKKPAVRFVTRGKATVKGGCGLTLPLVVRLTESLNETLELGKRPRNTYQEEKLSSPLINNTTSPKSDSLYNLQ